MNYQDLTYCFVEYEFDMYMFIKEKNNDYFRQKNHYLQ